MTVSLIDWASANNVHPEYNHAINALKLRVFAMLLNYTYTGIVQLR